MPEQHFILQSFTQNYNYLPHTIPCSFTFLLYKLYIIFAKYNIYQNNILFYIGLHRIIITHLTVCFIPIILSFIV